VAFFKTPFIWQKKYLFKQSRIEKFPSVVQAVELFRDLFGKRYLGVRETRAAFLATAG
jgi:hypothetical protein